MSPLALPQTEGKLLGRCVVPVGDGGWWREPELGDLVRM